MSKSSKFDEATARARGTEIVPAKEAESLSLATLGDTEIAESVRAFTPDVLARFAEAQKRGEIEIAARLLTLEEGQMIENAVLDSSGIAEIEDVNTKQTKQVKNWQLTLESGIKVSMLGAAQLDRALEKIPFGAKVIIARGATARQQGKAKQLTQYFVARVV